LLRLGDLQCVRRDDAWVYRLTATRVALSSMFSRGRHGGGSLDLGSFIESSAEEFRALERLPVALASVIDRSLAVPYLRLLFDRASVPFRRGAALTVQRHAGDTAPVDERSVVVRARRLTLDSARPELCRRLEQTLTAEPALLAEAEQAFRAGRGAPVDLPLQPDRAATGGRLLARSDRAHLSGRPPGWYPRRGALGRGRRPARRRVHRAHGRRARGVGRPHAVDRRDAPRAQPRAGSALCAHPTRVYALPAANRRSRRLRRPRLHPLRMARRTPGVAGPRREGQRGARMAASRAPGRRGRRAAYSGRALALRSAPARRADAQRRLPAARPDPARNDRIPRQG
jgi:hypothetical protein